MLTLPDLRTDGSNFHSQPGRTRPRDHAPEVLTSVHVTQLRVKSAPRHHLLLDVGEHSRMNPRPEIALRLTFTCVRSEPGTDRFERAGVEDQLREGPSATRFGAGGCVRLLVRDLDRGPRSRGRLGRRRRAREFARGGEPGQRSRVLVSAGLVAVGPPIGLGIHPAFLMRRLSRLR